MISRAFWRVFIPLLFCLFTLIAVAAPATAFPNITGVSPASVSAGGPSFNLTCTGTGFNAVTHVQFDFVDMTIVSQTDTQIVMAVPSSEITTPRFVIVSVWVGSSGTGRGFNVVNATPTISSVSPSSALAGDPDTTVTVAGTNFTASSVIQWNGANLTTTYVSSTSLTAVIPAADLATWSTSNITVFDASNGTSSPAPFVVSDTVPMLDTLTPSSTTAGGGDFTLTVHGFNFNAGSVIDWNGSPLATTYVSNTEMTCAVPAADIIAAGSANVTVTNSGPGGGTTSALSFTINAPTPAITSISPDSAHVGDADITVTVSGANFTASSTVLWNGANLTTTYVSGATLTAVLPSTFLSAVTTAAVTVGDPNGTSNALTFQVANTVPTEASLSPASATAGDSGLTLTVSGVNFNGSSVVTWGGSPLTTTYLSPTSVSSPISADQISLAGTFPVIVTNSGMGGGASSPLTFTVNDPVPAAASLSPSSATVGDPAFTLVVNGSGFIHDSSVQVDGHAVPTTYVSSTKLTVAVPALLLTVAGSADVTVVNAAPGGGTSTPIVFTVNNATPAITSLSPAEAVAGDPATIITVTGTKFVAASGVNWNGAPLPTTYVSATQLTVTAPAAMLMTAALVNVTVANPAPGGGVSAPAVFTVKNPKPAISGIAPAEAFAGDPTTTVTVTGTNFVPSSVVNWNGAPLPTTYVSATQLTVTAPAAMLMTAALVNVTVANPASGGGVSAPAVFTVKNPKPVITSISPAEAFAGDPTTTFTVTGTNFVPSSVFVWDGSPLATSYLSATRITANVPASSLALAKSVLVFVNNPAPGGGASGTITFKIKEHAPGAVITLTPATATAGDAEFSMAIHGSHFLSQSLVIWNGVALTPTSQTSTDLIVTIPAMLVAKAGLSSVSVTTSAGSSEPAKLTVRPLGGYGTGLKMVSVPYDYPNKSILTDILGWVDTATGAESDPASVAMVYWSPATTQYVVPEVSHGLRLGQGYWTRIPVMNGKELSLVTKGVPAPAGGCSIPLTAGWNMIGDPFPASVPLANLGVVYGGGDSAVHSFADAAHLGVVSPVLFTYDSGASAQYRLVSLSNSADALNPMAGYWVLALRSCTLVVPHP